MGTHATYTAGLSRQQASETPHKACPRAQTGDLRPPSQCDGGNAIPPVVADDDEAFARQTTRRRGEGGCVLSHWPVIFCLLGLARHQATTDPWPARLLARPVARNEAICPPNSWLVDTRPPSVGTEAIACHAEYYIQCSPSACPIPCELSCHLGPSLHL